LIAIAKAERRAGQPHDTGCASSDHFQLRPAAKAQFFKAADLLNSADNLPHDSRLAT
jgi:hypothetical protein